MTPKQSFQESINGSSHLYRMYIELRKFRGLGKRGRLDAQNNSLLWIPRSSVVMSISALDAYVHSVILERVPQILRTGNIPDELAGTLAGIMPVKDARSFLASWPYISGGNSISLLTDKLKENLSFISYQSPEKIILGYKLIGVDNVFASVAEKWQGPNSTEADIKRTLAGYVKRRNQIAHEGDLEANHSSRAISPDYAKRCHDFVDTLVNRLDNLVYAPKK